MDSLLFLQQVQKLKPRPVYAVFGEEDFLRRQVLAALRLLVLESADNAFGLSNYAGETATFAAIRDELDTLPFVGPRRLVIVEDADEFVSNYRDRLEKHVASPSATGVLVLSVKTWRSNTKLAKLLEGESAVECKTPRAQQLPGWCVQWAQSQHGKKLLHEAARLLVDLVGPEMGFLDQEIAKLAAYVGNAKQIDPADVDKLVGNSWTETIWKAFDAIGAGQAGPALTILDRLLEQGEDPMRTLGAFSMQLRRLAQVARLSEQGQPLSMAMDHAGVPPFARQGCEQQVRHLGRQRLDRLYDWLVEADLGMKGSSQLTPRTLLEQLIVKLARYANGE